eukprot:5466441-Amphidinium_carterae.1
MVQQTCRQSSNTLQIAPHFSRPNKGSMPCPYPPQMCDMPSTMSGCLRCAASQHMSQTRNTPHRQLHELRQGQCSFAQ